MRRFLLPLILLFVSETYSQKPVYMTESPFPLGTLRLEFGVGAEYLEKAKAPAIDFPKTELRACVATARIGVAPNVDLELDWRGKLFATYPGNIKASDWGDLTISTKINLFKSSGGTSGIAVRSSVKLPNTSYYPYKLGSDQTDFSFNILASTAGAIAELRGNLGFAIVGDPTRTGKQNDLFIYSGAILIPGRSEWHVFAECSGFNGYFENDAKIVARGGVTGMVGSVAMSVFGGVRFFGDNRDISTAFESSENWSIGLFLKKNFEL